MMGLIGCPEKSVINYQSTFRIIPEVRISRPIFIVRELVLNRDVQ